MKKILTIAAREYRAMVGTKAFLISIIMMPVLMLSSLFALELMKTATSVKERSIAVIDHTGRFAEPIQLAADEKNRLVDELVALDDSPTEDESTEAEDQASNINLQPGLLGINRDKYLFEFIDPAGVNEQTLADLSDRVREQKLYAFVEIPITALNDEEVEQADDQANDDKKIRFFAMDSSFSEARRWLELVVNNEVRSSRLLEADIDPEEVLAASQPVQVLGMGLVERASDGSLKTIEQTDAMAAIFLPMGVMLLMFMVVFMSSQPMLESVLEEKSQRIAEVLLGSCSPFELMCGKLIGTVAGSLTIFAIYVVGAFAIAFAGGRGYLDQVPFHLIPWFVVFQIVAVLFYASIFLAIGASVSQLKEAQSLLLPVWMLMMSPMFVWLFIVRDPLGPFATYFSLFPPATPTCMMLRMATGQAIPVWQPILGMVLTTAATLAIVGIAARIFRVGILWQGKTPKLREILKWAVTG